MTQVTIIGSGFGGLTAVRELRRQDPELQIRLVAPKPEFIYYPSLRTIRKSLPSCTTMCPP